MSESGGLDSFSVESDDGIDAGALERMRERMRQSRAQSKRDKKQEAKQKQTETNLAQVLIALLRNQQAGLIQVVTKALAAGIPANFIIAILALRFEAVRKEVGLVFKSSTKEQKSSTDEKSLVPANFTDQTLPLKTKLELDIWLQFLIDQAKSQPRKLLESIKTPQEEKKANTEIKNLIGYVMQDYLQLQKVEFIGQNIIAFSGNFCDSLAEYLTDYLAQQQKLTSE